MCGILGILGNYDRQTVNTMLSVQGHRGPDAAQLYEEPTLVLGHNRLSIIDLSAKANQPFISNDKRFVLVYNGEVYNYKELRKQIGTRYDFKTTSDTEVLLALYALYGTKCLSMLNGMFSFAIWDTEKQEIFIARDRFGVKPLYYYRDEAYFIFASEIKTLFAGGVRKVPHAKVWANYFDHGSYGSPNETFWDSVHQLPAGCFMQVTAQQCAIQRWYSFADRVQPLNLHDISYEEAKKQYQALMLDSIELRFRSDVPLGFNVSGGLDSSTLLMMVNSLELGKDITAFTFYTGSETYDELPWVSQMMSLTNNKLEKVKIEAQDIETLNESISWHQDEPFGGVPTLAYSALFARARELGIKVLLDGQGMDEQWAGYDYYFNQNNATIQGVRTSPFRPNIMSTTLQGLVSKTLYPAPYADRLLNLQYRDLFYTKIPRALRFNDRISMAHSTELREPFLDYRMVEFAFSLPESYKMKDGVQKRMLRDLVAKHLSDSITYAPKRPLQTPQREWLGKELRSWVDKSIAELLNSSYAHWFDKEQIFKEWKDYQAGDQEVSFHVWQWIGFNTLVSR